MPKLEWKPEHVAFIHNALYGVTQEGTSARSFVNAPYKSGGKTGTAQVIEIKANEKYNASQIDERRRFTETVLSGVSAGVIGLDLQGLVELPNRAASELLGGLEAVDGVGIGKEIGGVKATLAALVEELLLPEVVLVTAGLPASDPIVGETEAATMLRAFFRARR